LSFIADPSCYRIKPEPREWGGEVKRRYWHTNGTTVEIMIEIEGDVNDMPKMGEKIRVREILDDGGAE
jgi:hypothetical protein